MNVLFYFLKTRQFTGRRILFPHAQVRGPDAVCLLQLTDPARPGHAEGDTYRSQVEWQQSTSSTWRGLFFKLWSVWICKENCLAQESLNLASSRPDPGKDFSERVTSDDTKPRTLKTKKMGLKPLLSSLSLEPSHPDFCASHRAGGTKAKTQVRSENRQTMNIHSRPAVAWFLCLFSAVCLLKRFV